MEITAKMVAELRRRTGLPMMKCKKALVDAGGDIDAAVENLRKAGEKNIDKLKSREMKDGLVFTTVESSGAAAVAVLCETDFVARAEAFIAFGEELVKRLFAHGEQGVGTGDDIASFEMEDGRTVKEHLDELVGSKIRENMKVGSWACFRPDNGIVCTYVHHNSKIATLVELAGENLDRHDAVSELGNDLGMQLAFHSGVQALDRDGLDSEFVEKERAIFVAQVQNMPEEKQAQIAEGKLSKRLKDVVLLEQPFIKNEKQTVAEHVAEIAKETGADISITRFARVAAGV